MISDFVSFTQRLHEERVVAGDAIRDHEERRMGVVLAEEIQNQGSGATVWAVVNVQGDLFCRGVDVEQALRVCCCDAPGKREWGAGGGEE